ncbi:MAG: hypothetical protein ACOX9B_07570 [Candidatus Xenobium sp.]|nr:hypothetical protein [Burkholderiales bacterium]
MRTEAIEAGLDARKACIEERSWKLREHRRGAPDDADAPHPHQGVGGVSRPRRPNATPGGGFRPESRLYSFFEGVI